MDRERSRALPQARLHPDGLLIDASDIIPMRVMMLAAGLEDVPNAIPTDLMAVTRIGPTVRATDPVVTDLQAGLAGVIGLPAGLVAAIGLQAGLATEGDLEVHRSVLLEEMRLVLAAGVGHLLHPAGVRDHTIKVGPLTDLEAR
jgi:hypothetical protein